MPAIHIHDVHKEYAAKKKQDSVAAVRGIDLEIEQGCFFALLGPSGCGKSTLLRMIAGLESVSKGKIFIGDREVTNLAAEKRNIGMVFQNYALFPHMNVFHNVAFGLKAHKCPPGDIADKVHDALQRVQLSDKVDHMAPDLSGGEQQRVALARALVIEPEVLLFDEPLSNLDARLRIDTRQAIKDIVSTIKTTSIYVTHDQEEAMALADDMAIMRGGEILQRGSPQELYTNPSNSFAATFLGRANIIPIHNSAENKNDAQAKWSFENDIPLPDNLQTKLDVNGTNAFICIRPHDLALAIGDDAWFHGRIEVKEYLGTHIRLQVHVKDIGEFELHLSPQSEIPNIGSAIGIRLHDQHSVQFFTQDIR